MKKSVNLFFFLLLIGLEFVAQIPVVSMSAMNYGYFGIDNEIDIAVSECRCQDLIVTSDNGTIGGKNCHYILKPAHIGQANISIKVKRKNAVDELGTSAIIIYRVPDPVVTSNAFNLTDTISNKELLIQSPTLTCRLPGFRIEYVFRIIHYRLTIYRNSSIYYQENSDSNSISDALKTKLTTLIDGDVLSFDEIIVESGEGKRNLSPIKKIYYSRNKD